jgi:hypothetical protein
MALRSRAAQGFSSLAQMSMFPLPLYHGISTAFIASIIEHEQGASDPVSLSKGVDCINSILDWNMNDSRLYHTLRPYVACYA